MGITYVLHGAKCFAINFRWPKILLQKQGCFSSQLLGGQSVYFGKLALGIPDTLGYFLVAT